MFVLKRNQIIITALIVMIAVAGYLNYQDSRETEHTGFTLNDQGEIEALAPTSSIEDYVDIGEALAFSHDPTISMEEIEATLSYVHEADEDPGTSVFVNSTTDEPSNTSFFVQAKFDREQSRSKEKTLLTEMINNVNLTDDIKAEAADAMMDIQRRIERETAAEAMIEAKGFSEVYVRINEDSVDVVVNKEALTDAEIAQIMDIIKRKTGLTIEKIHISPMRR